MEEVVLFGTARRAILNGYTSAGKTGTAQKVDPATHLYSKTMHIGSFAGIAPVNNPVIAVAVIMDNPKGAYYGAQVSAPVFAEVAQAVLEYLNVPHDVDVRATKSPLKQAKLDKPIHEDDGGAAQEDINALFAAANDLPADDPLRQPQQAIPQPSAQAPAPPPQAAASVTAKPGDNKQNPVSTAATPVVPAAPPPKPKYVTVSDGKQIIVPSLIGLPIRTVIEKTAAQGLQVQISGSGTVREQAPAAGTQVPSGTKIIVRCGR
jgi:cell division protein FtsI (penicillin-binding protein 3)